MQNPKLVPESGRPAAERQLASTAHVRQFVDREEPIAIFQAALARPQPAKPLVLVFHGGAGTGKSRLRRELVKLVDSRQQAEDRAVVTATLDFDVPIHRQPDAALFSLRNALRETHQVRFPSFDLAYAVLWQKTHPDKPLGDDLKPLLVPDSLLSRLLDESGKLPLIGLVPKISSLLAESLDPLNPRPLDPSLRSWWERRGERELEDLPQMEPAAIVDRLPALWASDLKDWLGAASHKPQAASNESGKKQESESYHQDTKALGGSGRMDALGRRAVLFVDSYEKLWGTTDEGPGTKDVGQKTDAWVRELVKQLPEALWVISGRQKLRWEEVEKEWADVLSHHELGALPEHSAREFLSSCGITDEPIQDAIAKGSQGLPHYLNLAADTFQEIEQSGQRVPGTSASSSTSQAETPEELFAQFIRHLDQPEIATLQVLSASRFWNYGLFEHLVTEYQTGYPLTAYDDLSRFSFVGEGAAPETRTMHDLMREALQEHQAPDLRKRVHLFLHEYYAKQLEGLDVKSITEKHKAALTEAFYHGRQARSAEGLWSWFEGASRVFHEAMQFRLLIPLHQVMVQALEADLGPNHADVATALWRLAVNMKRSGQYDQAEQLLRRSLAIAEAGEEPGHVHYLDFLDWLAQVLYEQGRSKEAEVVARRMVAMLEGRPNGDVTSRAKALDVLARALIHQAKHAEAEVLLSREVAICETEFGRDHSQTLEALEGLGALFHEQGRYAEALVLTRRVLAAKEMEFGPEHPLVVILTDSLAAVLSGLGRFGEAEALNRQALTLKEKIYGPDHAATAVSLNNLAGLLGAQGRHAEAEPLIRRALAAHERKCGPDHPYTIRMASGLIIVLSDQGKFTEAEAMVLRLIPDCERKLGPDHPDTANALYAAGIMYRSQGRYAEAESYLRRALEIDTKAYGPEQPPTLHSCFELAYFEELRGRYAEAELLYRDVLQKRMRVLGPEHQSTARTALRLAGLCLRDGRYAEAGDLYRRALAIREKVFGIDHPFVAEVLDGLAKVCEQTGRAGEAQELSARAKSVRDKNAQAQTPG